MNTNKLMNWLGGGWRGDLGQNALNSTQNEPQGEKIHRCKVEHNHKAGGLKLDAIFLDEGVEDKLEAEFNKDD